MNKYEKAFSVLREHANADTVDALVDIKELIEDVTYNKGKYLNELATLETMVETYLDADVDLSVCLSAINDLCGLVLNCGKLEKALDKACEELSQTKTISEDDKFINSAEEWKEWCLKKDTVEMMNSNDYKERLKAEYYQLKIRYEKLDKMLIMWELDKLDFTPKCSHGLLREQLNAMRTYLQVLRKRAIVENVELGD